MKANSKHFLNDHDDEADDEIEIKVNEEYAKRFEVRSLMAGG